MKKFALFAALALVATSAFAGSLNFPQAGVYEIHSAPSFLVTVGSNQEVVTCDATLVVKAGNPYINEKGLRRVDLQIVDWKANGKSTLLGGDIKFRMEQGSAANDSSFVETYAVAGARPDFPAQAQFSVPYQVETPFGTVKGLYGVTRGAIKAFPPSGDVFTMEKGDVANLMAQLMPEPLSELSAAGDTATSQVTVQPLSCACPSDTLDIN